MDAILFSAKSSMVDVDDAIRHLSNHKQLYWEVGFQIKADKFSFPILGFIHIAGGQVEYRATISNIVPYDPAHYKDEALAERVKPEAWILEWKKRLTEGRPYPWRNALVMTQIDPYSHETKSFKKVDGGVVTLAPHGYIRVVPPDPESSDTITTPRTLRNSVAEKHLEEVVLHHLSEIEPGLTLVERQLCTPAGRLDLLCKDVNGTYVVVELKKAQGTDQVLGQILRYMGWVLEGKGADKVRGIIIVQSKDRRLSYAIKAATNVTIKEFKMVFA